MATKRVEVPTYLADRDALSAVLATGQPATGDALDRLEVADFVDSKGNLTELGRASATECNRLREVSPFTGLARRFK